MRFEFWLPEYEKSKEKTLHIGKRVEEKLHELGEPKNITQSGMW